MNQIIIFKILFCLIGFLGSFLLVYTSPVFIKKSLNKILNQNKINILIKIFLWYFFIGGCIGFITVVPDIMNDTKNIDRIAVYGTFSMCFGICLGTGLRIFKKLNL